jgi:hypothetical protein
MVTLFKMTSVSETVVMGDEIAAVINAEPVRRRNSFHDIASFAAVILFDGQDAAVGLFVVHAQQHVATEFAIYAGKLKCTAFLRA